MTSCRPRRCSPRCPAWSTSPSSPWARPPTAQTGNCRWARGTGCSRPCARTAWSGWPKRGSRTRSGTPSPRATWTWPRPPTRGCAPPTRAAGCELAAEQDNLHAALRLAITRRDGDTALRFVRALGWYWQILGQPGDPQALARDVLELQPRERSPRIAEARIVCALTAAGIAYEIAAVQPVLASAVADYAELTGGAAPSNPIAAMGEPMLALHDRDPERAFAVLDRYVTSPDPWIQAAVPLLRGSFGRLLGHIDWAESGCRESLAAFRALGESWGAASVLIQMCELAQLRGDYPAALAAIEEAGSYGRKLGAWGDLNYIDGMLAAIRLRMGDLERARAHLERAERAASERSASLNDIGAWLALVRAELHCREGDLAAAARNCEKVLAWLDEQS